MNLERDTTKAVRMTGFLCRELLYEYVGGTLDPRREKDIEDFLPTCRESQRELERLRRALRYTEGAAEARVTKTLHEALLSFEPVWQKTLREWTLWSSQRGWRMLPYVFVLVTLAVGLFVFKPWQAAELKEVTLVQEQKADSLPPAPPPANAVVEPRPGSAEAMTPLVTAMPSPASVVTKPVAPPVAIPSPARVPTKTPAREETPIAEAVAAVTLPEEPTISPPISKGELSRGEIAISDFANSLPAIQDKIYALGGKSIGKNKLSAASQEDQTQIDFTLPESNYAELEMFLGTFGPVRFATENVPRVMPEGQIRIILIIKDADTDEATPETP